jgi:hypothetical protein
MRRNLGKGVKKKPKQKSKKCDRVMGDIMRVIEKHWKARTMAELEKLMETEGTKENKWWINMGTWIWEIENVLTIQDGYKEYRLGSKDETCQIEQRIWSDRKPDDREVWQEKLRFLDISQSAELREANDK